MDQFTEIRTWAEISRSALRHNLNVAKELTGGTNQGKCARSRSR